jgi:hypothetical protein
VSQARGLPPQYQADRPSIPNVRSSGRSEIWNEAERLKSICRVEGKLDIRSMADTIEERDQ